jgi:hypothetical protein
MDRQQGLPAYQKCWHIFDFMGFAAYNAAPSKHPTPD